MNKTIYIQGKAVTLTDKNYIASGGEASVYKYNNSALKIYHNPNKCIEERKITELQAIKNKNVLKPLDIIYSKDQKHIGYSMDLCHSNIPLCKLFTKTFKLDNNIGYSDITELIKNIQKTVKEVHNSNCLIVDLNELNILVESNFIHPTFIDVDSYQTKNFKATAIMESIRDRTVKNDNWTVLSDWYSFAIIAFQLYIGIHPYKGKHPSYKANEWIKRMDDNISVFDKNVSLPSVCESFSVIPAKYLDWFKSLFVNGARDLPPILDNVQINIPIANNPNKIIFSNSTFDVSLINTLQENIQKTYNIFGINYHITSNAIYKNNSKILDISKNSSIIFTNNNTPILIQKNQNTLFFYNLNTKELISQIQVSEYYTENAYCYSLYENNLTKHEFVEFGTKIIHKTKSYPVSYASTLYEGCIIQDLLGKKYISYVQNDLYINIHIQEIDNYRILEAVRIKNFIVLLAEQKGIYSRIIIDINSKDKYNIQYTSKVLQDIDYSNINFAVLDNGVAVLLSSDGNNIEIFKDLSNCKIVNNPPFNSTMKLFNIGNNIYYIDGNKIFNVKLK